MNRADGEKIRGLLNGFGLKETGREDEADLIVTVACSVRQSAVDRIFGRPAKWQKKRKRGELITILTGCVLPSDRRKMSDYFDDILPIGEMEKIKRFLPLSSFSDPGNFHQLPDKTSKFQAYVPIMTGCDNFCAYCVVPYVRGREISRSAAEIIAECRQLVKAGYKEITLLGQNVNSYRSPRYHSPEVKLRGKQKQLVSGYNFPKLLKEIDQIPGDYWLRFVTSHPKDCSDALLKVMAGGRHVTPYLHLPIQSGDNFILRAMNRKYTMRQYIDLVKKARRIMPGLMLSTDLIVGFPGETERRFLNSLKTVAIIGFDMIYIAQYSPRAGTAAARLPDDVLPREKKQRAEAINEALKKTALKNNRPFVGRTVRVLVEKCRGGKCFGKTADFRTVTLAGSEKLVGRFVAVKIDKAESFGLSGYLV